MQIVSHAEVDPGLNISDSAATHMLHARKLLELKVSDLLKALSDMSWRSAVGKFFLMLLAVLKSLRVLKLLGVPTVILSNINYGLLIDLNPNK